MKTIFTKLETSRVKLMDGITRVASGLIEIMDAILFVVDIPLLETAATYLDSFLTQNSDYNLALRINHILQHEAIEAANTIEELSNELDAYEAD